MKRFLFLAVPMIFFCLIPLAVTGNVATGLADADAPATVDVSQVILPALVAQLFWLVLFAIIAGGFPIRRNFNATLDRLGVGDGPLLQFVQPFKRLNLELFAHLLPAQPGPGAKIDFTQTGQNRRRAPAVRCQRDERLLRALHRTDVNGIKGCWPQIIRQPAGLMMSVRRKFHVDAATEHTMVTRFHFAMT